MKLEYNCYSEEWQRLEFLEQVGEMLGERLENCVFVAEASRVGWRNARGVKVFGADTPADFLREAVGLRCSYNAIIEDDGNEIKMVVYHHDSPTGEYRNIITLREHIRRELDGVSIQELQKLLTKLREVEPPFNEPYTAGFTTYWFDEDMAGKPRRRFTKEDFVEIFRAYCLETGERFDLLEYYQID